MNALYNVIEFLCRQNDVNVTTMCKEASVPRSNLTDLKMGRQSGLSAKNLGKVARYFGMSSEDIIDLAEAPGILELVARDNDFHDAANLLADIRKSKVIKKEATQKDDLPSLDENLRAKPKPKEDATVRMARLLAPAELVIVSSKLNDAGNNDLIKYGHYLENQDEYKLSEKERRFRLVQSPPLDVKEPEPPPVRYIRYYRTPAAAGYASPIEGEDYEIIELPANAPARADYCTRVSGDSMAPYIKNGERIYVKRDEPLTDFDVGVFFWAGDVYCKQICVDYFGSVYLLSANPKRQDANITIPKDEVVNLVFFGKVLLPKKLPQPEYR